MTGREEQGEQVHEIRWEVLEPKEKRSKVRKPSEFKHFFGDETETENTTDDDDENWKEVNFKEKKQLKIKRQKERKKLARSNRSQHRKPKPC